MNRLYYGDCLTIMQDMAKWSVDLIYLDPPFNSNREYNAIYKDETGRALPDQVEAFNDTWTMDEERERALQHMPILLRETGIEDSVAEFWRIWLNALRGTNPKLLAYLSYMVERLAHMRPILKPTGSIYLHCDPTASHYLKVLMDGIFGHSNFRNEIVWKRAHSHNSAKRYGPIHDVLLFYTAGSQYTWTNVRQPYGREYEDRFFRFDDEDGRGRYWTGDLTGSGIRHGETGKEWRGFNPTSKNRHWMVSPADLDKLDTDQRIYWPPTAGAWPKLKRYLREAKGIPLQDVMTDIYGLSTMGAPKSERLGYRTQKPLALLERIIEASSNPGDVIFDPFCGCGTTMEAAERLNRKWIGIDIAIHAVKRVARVRLIDRLRLVEGQDFTIEGVPRNLEGAQDLWKSDPYHFQKWAVEQVDGFVTTRRTSDGGIDGRLYFDMPGERDLQSMALEVKGGRQVGISVLRELRGVLEDDRALMAGLVVMYPPGDRQAANFGRYRASAGDLKVHGRPYPRMQMLTVQEILDGKRFDTPSVVGRGSSQTVFGIADGKAQQVLKIDD